MTKNITSLILMVARPAYKNKTLAKNKLNDIAVSLKTVPS
ncbi:MAG: hypothetical protein ACD_69C00065G0001 [uncultured bacterium]|nr:MAG: hypothetical protein ACD_69C00065G0001 [uncultured bacterium]